LIEIELFDRWKKGLIHRSAPGAASGGSRLRAALGRLLSSNSVAALRLRAPRSPAITSLGQFESQRAGHRIGVGEAELEPLADTISLARFLADELAGSLIEAEKFAAEVAHEQ
jgi:hypothetical protein